MSIPDRKQDHCCLLINLKHWLLKQYIQDVWKYMRYINTLQSKPLCSCLLTGLIFISTLCVFSDPSRHFVLKQRQGKCEVICQHFHFCGSDSKCCQSRCEYARILNVTNAVWWQGVWLPSGPGALKCHCYFLTTSLHERTKCHCPMPALNAWLLKTQVLCGVLQVEQKGLNGWDPPYSPYVFFTGLVALN